MPQTPYRAFPYRAFPSILLLGCFWKIPGSASVNPLRCKILGTPTTPSNTVGYSLRERVIGIDSTIVLRLRNDLCCVGWGIKLYSLTHSLEILYYIHFVVNTLYVSYRGRIFLIFFALFQFGCISHRRSFCHCWSVFNTNSAEADFRRLIKTFLFAWHTGTSSPGALGAMRYTK